MLEDHSLIKQAEQEAQLQPQLFSTADMAPVHFEEGEAHGDFTGERLFKFKPDLYSAIVKARAEGMGTRQIARAFRVSPNTVRAVIQRERSSVDTEKKEIVNNLRKFIRFGSERMLEEVDEMDRNKLPINVAVAVDKLQLLEGNATSRVEHVKAPAIEDFNKFVESLPVDAEIIGSRVETPKQIAAMSEAGSPGIPSSDTATIDERSPVLTTIARENGGDDTALDTKKAEREASVPVESLPPDPQKAGGEGVGNFAGGGQKTHRFGQSENFSQGGDPSDPHPQPPTKDNP